MPRKSEGLMLLALVRAGEVEELRAHLALNLSLATERANTLVPDEHWNEVPLVHISVQLGKGVMVEALLEFGADPMARNRSTGGTAAHAAVTAAGRRETEEGVAILSALIDANDEILDARDFRGDTPLHLAARLGAADCAVVLLQSAASVKTENLDRKTPIELAASKKFRQMLMTYSTPTNPSHQKKKDTPVLSNEKNTNDHKSDLELLKPSEPLPPTPASVIVSPPSTLSSSASTKCIPRSRSLSPQPNKVGSRSPSPQPRALYLSPSPQKAKASSPRRFSSQKMPSLFIYALLISLLICTSLAAYYNWRRSQEIHKVRLLEHSVFAERRSRLVCQVNLKQRNAALTSLRRRKLLAASQNFSSKYPPPHFSPSDHYDDQVDDPSHEVVDLVLHNDSSKNKNLILSRPILRGLFRNFVLPALAVLISHFFKGVIGFGRHLITHTFL